MPTMTGIGKSFLGVRVLSDVRLQVEAGEVHAVMGENGAGKVYLWTLSGVAAAVAGILLGGFAGVSGAGDPRAGSHHHRVRRGAAVRLPLKLRAST